MPSRTVVRRTNVRTGQEPSSRTTDLRAGQELSSCTTDLRTGQVPSSSSRTADLRTGHLTNQERRITRSHRLSEHTALAAHTALTANPPNPPVLFATNPSDSDPRSYREALNSLLYKHWKSAMREESRLDQIVQARRLGTRLDRIVRVYARLDRCFQAQLDRIVRFQQLALQYISAPVLEVRAHHFHYQCMIYALFDSRQIRHLSS